LAQARSGREVADLALATMVPVPGLPAKLDRLSQLTLKIGGVELGDFELGDRRQQFTDDRLVVVREPVGQGVPLPVSEPKLARWLKAEPLIQSDHPRIVKQARRVVGDAADTVTAAQLLRAWVHKALTQKSVLGVPSALETLETRVGDCNEHATLYAALARAAGVPARIAVGLVYVEGRFGYHAWNEVWTADGWLSVDPTWDQSPVDVGHLRVVHGNLDQQVLLLRVMGQITLELVEYR
jgi:transglutaminase-like putative cysteine protease